MRLDVLFDQRLALLMRPFVQAGRRIMDVTVKESPMIGVEHDLPDRRAGAFRHHAIDSRFRFLSSKYRENPLNLASIACLIPCIYGVAKIIHGKKSKETLSFQ